MKKIAMSLACSAILSGCVLFRTADHGPMWVGQPVDALVEHRGTPDRQTTAPSGAAVYVYDKKNLGVCDEEYFVREGKVVGFMEQGLALNCSGTAGVTK